MNYVMRPDTPKKLTGDAKRKWIDEEINHIRDLNRDLSVLFRENEAGQMDKYRILTDLFLAEDYLKRYICNLREQLEAEEQFQAEQDRQAKGKIYQLASFRRDKMTNALYNKTGIDVRP